MIRLNALTKMYTDDKYMDNIFEPNSKFNFEQIRLTSPAAMIGGNHMIKFLVKDLPLYIQPPRCKTKNGIFKTGKRYYSDLVFSQDNEEFIQWLEELEKYVCRCIYSNREKWFDSDMEQHDIENYFTPPLKLYKSGKLYLVRVNAPHGLTQTSLNIYNESEEKVDPDSIEENSNIITILEVQGVKCSSRSFQLEFEMKQMMLLNPTNIFDKCILGDSVKKPKEVEVQEVVDAPLETLDEETNKENKEKEETNKENKEKEETNQENKEKDKEETLDTSPKEEPVAETQESKNEDENILFEFDLNLDKVSDPEPLQIKPRTDVYYEMYKEAKRKARMARNLALSAYMEAKQIKDTYKLEDLTDSDDSDTEDSFFSKQKENL
jgi:hypothetical protein